jgi:hypothetical protein
MCQERKLGFAAGRNRKSEEERSHCGLQQREKKGFLGKNLFRNRKSRTMASVEFADEKGPGQMRGETGTLRSVHCAQPPKIDGCEVFDLSGSPFVLLPLPIFCSYQPQNPDTA